MGAEVKPTLRSANRLLRDGILALSKVQSNGIRIDKRYLTTELEGIKKKREEIKAGMESDENVKWWKKKFGQAFNLNSNDQLSEVLFDHMGLQPTKMTASGKASADASALEELVETYDVQMLKDIVAPKAEQGGRHLHRRDTEGNWRGRPSPSLLPPPHGSHVPLQLHWR